VSINEEKTGHVLKERKKKHRHSQKRDEGSQSLRYRTSRKRRGANKRGQVEKGKQDGHGSA